MDPHSRRGLSFRLPSSFRLKRRRLIKALFDRSRTDVETTATGCIRIVYRKLPRIDARVDAPLQVGFTTGRAVRRAVDRNQIKRYMREAFRHNQHVLVDAMAEFPDETLTLMILFRGAVDQARQGVPRHLPTVMHRVAGKIQEGSTSL